MATQMSKSQLVEKIATTTELSKRDVKNVMDTLTDVGHKELKKAGDQGPQGHQPVHGRGNDVQGQACPQDRARKAGQGRQGRCLRRTRTSELKAPERGPLFFG